MDRVRTLSKLAAELNRQGNAPKDFPSAFLFTDEGRTPDLPMTLNALPKNVGVIFRHYDAENRCELAHEISEHCKKLDLPLLIAGDWRLARACQAEGVHLPQYMIKQAPVIKRADPRLVISAACHNEKSLRQAEQAGVDFAFLSPLFPTKSHADAKGLNRARIAGLVRSVDMPVYGLGGINVETITHLRGTGICGIGAIEGLVR